MKRSTHGSKVVLLAGVLCAILATDVAAQQPGSAAIFVNASQTNPVEVPVGSTATLEIVATASKPILLMVGFQSAFMGSPYGALGLNPYAPETFAHLNGFDSTHVNHAISFTSTTGIYTEFGVPYQTGIAGQHVYLQALVHDPSVPEGATLTNTLHMNSITPPPMITETFPNHTAGGGQIIVRGENFASNLNDNHVTILDTDCPVVAGSPTWLQVIIPEGARSGALAITTPQGATGGSNHLVSSWCSLINTPFDENQVPAVLTEPTTILGQITLAGQKDRFTVHAEAGEEIYVEVHSWDTTTQVITGSGNSHNLYFDPIVRLLRSGVVVAEDDDSGPGLNAGFGFSGGDTYFVADETRDYVVEIDTYLSLGTGNYICIIGTRQPQNIPLTVESIVPNLAIAGYPVAIHCPLVTGTNPSHYAVTVGGVSVPITGMSPGKLTVTIPQGLRSGQVDVQTPNGVTSNPVFRMKSWLSVVSINVTLGANTTQPLNPGDSIMGTIALGTDKHTYSFNAVMGESYTFEVLSLDSASSRAITGDFLATSPLDPDIRITPHGAAGPILVSDGNGGPGFNAWIGSPSVPAWVAPSTGLFDINVLSFFGLSTGNYVLNFRRL